MSHGLTCQRDLFDLPDDVTYLNSAYMGPLPRRSAEAGRAAADQKLRPWHIGVDDFFDPVRRYRAAVARLLNVDESTIAVTPSVSYGVALAASNLAVSAGQRILVLAEQFPSNVYSWRELAERSDARLDVVERPADSDWTTAIVDCLDSDVAVVAVPPCHWTDGTRVDLAVVSEAVRAHDAALVVDTAQAAGALDLDVAALRPTFLLGATYKWLLGPYSLGFCYVDPAHHEGRPLESNWINRAGSDDFAGLVDYRSEYQPGARRFDMGEVSNFALMPVAISSLELVNDLGPARIAAYARSITDHIAAGAEALGLGVAAPGVRSDHLMGVRLPAHIDPGEVAQAMADAQVYVSVRGDSVRISAHVFNTMADADRLLEALAAATS